MSCSMNATTTVYNALPHDVLGTLKSYLSRAEWGPVPLDHSVEMAAVEAPEGLTEVVTKLVNDCYLKEFEPLAVFCRYNSPEVDTEFRIHSDGEVLGEQPTLACIIYLNDGDTGTGLFINAKHGSFPREGQQGIYTEDDHEWVVTDYCEQKVNVMFAYDARRFHSRWPPQANGHRFVVVGFFKEVGIGKA